MKWFTAFSVTLLFVVLYRPCLGQEKSNLKFLENLTDSLLQDVFSQSFENKPIRFAIRNFGAADEQSWFFENQIIEALKKEGTSVFFVPEDDHAGASLSEENVIIVEYRSLDIGIEYGPEIKKNQSPMLIQRNGKVGFSLRIISRPEGKILWNGSKSGTKFDWISLDSINEVENENISFVKGRQIKDSEASSLLQPILISVVSGVIVYLFYSLRSR